MSSGSMQPGAANIASARARHRLRQSGIGALAVEQLLMGQAVTSAADRVAIAEFVIRLLDPASSASSGGYDFPGGYAQRFDGIDPQR